MDKITVAAILREYGKWIRCEDFIKLVSQKLEIKERQAYNRIREAFERKEILKHVLSDKTTIYGIAEFGPYGFEQTLEVKPPSKTAKPGFFERRRIANQQKEREQEKILRLEQIHAEEAAAELFPEFNSFKIIAEKDRETYRKLYGEEKKG